MWKPIAGLVMALLAAGACGSGSSLGDAVVNQPAAGYHVSSASGDLDASAAAQATPANSGDVQHYLSRHTLSDGYSEVWQAGTDFVTIVALRFGDGGAAKGLIQLEATQLKAGAANVAADSRIPAASTFVFFGKTRLHGREVFCSGEIFPEATIAFLVTSCSDFPNSAVLARQVAVSQYLKAERVLKLAVPEIQPS
jgi:hypothetical protein